MREIHDKIEGDWRISDEVTLRGMATGDVVVVAGGTLVLRGMCCQNLRVGAGGIASIHGMVLGDVTNDGVLDVDGTIVGHLIDPMAKAIVRAGAMINGVRQV